MSILTWLKSIALLSLVIFLGFGSYLCLVTAQSERRLVEQASTTFSAVNAAVAHLNSATDQLSESVANVSTSITQTEADVRGVTTQFQGVAIGLQKTVSLVNAPCVPGPCGTVENANKTLATVRGTFGQVEVAANNFDKNEDHFYTQEDQLYADSDASMKSLDALLSSPDLNATIRNSSTITYNLGQTTGDFQNKFHTFLYPPPCIGWKCHIKTGYEIISNGSKFVEPAYWGWALVNQIKP